MLTLADGILSQWDLFCGEPAASGESVIFMMLLQALLPSLHASKLMAGAGGEVPVVGPTPRSSIPGVSQCGLWSMQRMVLLPKYAAPIVLSQTS